MEDSDPNMANFWENFTIITTGLDVPMETIKTCKDKEDPHSEGIVHMTTFTSDLE